MISKLLRWKHPIEYEVTPTVVDKGISWLSRARARPEEYLTIKDPAREL